MIVSAGEIGIAAFDAMDQRIGDQEIQRAINGDWSRACEMLCKLFDDLIGAERPVARQQRFQNPAADRRQFLAARATMLFGMR